ncbi:L-aspartate oxidase [Georgenia halophila]|uniref:L-aspartate oxidase n=1 Tax=Georgenia halophila TaxID=620889 RepID=A0ABP8LDD4_9MICO
MSARNGTVAVVGGGVAGASAALAAAAAGADVVLLTATTLLDSATACAQGGVAAAIWPDDSPERHARDTIAAGAGLCDPAAVEVLTREGAEAVRALVAAGAEFDRTDDGDLARGLEAAHSLPRILHAGGDASGLRLAEFLAGRLADSAVDVREGARMRDLVRRDGTVTGVRLDDATAGGAVVDADAVVLATGGLGRLYPATSNPAGALGDGILAAWRAGAVLADLEFVQFHPTTTPDGLLVSEAVRGAGAVLRDERGRRYLTDVDPRAELAPRDVVAAATATVIREQAGRPAYLDATGLAVSGVELAARFPTIHRGLAARGIDWRTEPVPVAPAAHFAMGGVRTDLDGRTNVPRLLAAGECARTGVHGANRLASNSLLEGLVFGARAGRAAARPARDAPVWDATEVDDAAFDGPGAGSGGGSGRALAALERATAAQRLAAVQAALRDGVGVERDADGLRAAVARLDRISLGRDAAAERAALARLVAIAADHRTESRGAHRRRDHPDTDVTLATPHAVVRGRTNQGAACSPAA